MGDRDPLVMDLLEVPEAPAPEEAAMHLIGMPAFEAVDLEDVMDELAVEDGAGISPEGTEPSTTAES